MNGRVYDPVVGRFVSPDPWIQDPTNSQSFNRYTYVWNNPLSFTDPTGELTYRRYFASHFTGGGTGVDAETAEDLNAAVEPVNEEPEEASSFDEVWDGGLSEAGMPKESAQQDGAAAGVLAVGWVGAGAEPTPVGEIAMGAVTAAAVLYYGPEILDKMEAEITGIMKKVVGPNGIQYSLRATKDGVYTCFKCASGVANLKAGEVWKYGETTNPSSRYTSTFLQTNNLRQVNEFYGNQIEIKVVEKMKIYNHAIINLSLPPGNRIFR